MSEELSYLVNLLGDDDPYVANIALAHIMGYAQEALPMIKERIRLVKNKHECDNLRQMYSIIHNELIINEFQSLIKDNCYSLDAWIELLSAIIFEDDFDRDYYRKSIQNDYYYLFEEEAIGVLTDIEIINRFGSKFKYEIGYRSEIINTSFADKRVYNLCNLSKVLKNHIGSSAAIDIIYLIQAQLCKLPLTPVVDNGKLFLIYSVGDNSSLFTNADEVGLFKYNKSVKKCSKLEHTILSFDYFVNEVSKILQIDSDSNKAEAIRTIIDIVNIIR